MKKIISLLVNPYSLITVLFLSLSTLGALYLVNQNQEVRRSASCQVGAGGCGNSNCCRSWEVYQDGCCKSTAGCSQNSDCSDNKACVNGTCQDSGWSARCGGSQNQCDCSNQGTKQCRGIQQWLCGNDCCWHYDPAQANNQECQNNQSCNLNCDPGFSCQLVSGVPQCVTDKKLSPTSTSSLCQGVADSGCTTGGRGGVDCAECRRTGGQVKQCQQTWYCCYSDGNCYQGTSQTQVICSGKNITNNTSKSVSGNIYRGCENNNKIGIFNLAPGQSKTAADCTQIDVPGYCGVCNSTNCSPSSPPAPSATPTPTPKSTTTPRPSSTPTSTPTTTPNPSSTQTPTSTPTSSPNPSSTQTPTSTPTTTPNPSSTQTPTSTPTTTPNPSSTQTPAPTRIVLPKAGIDSPFKLLSVFGTIVSLVGLLILL